MESYVVRIYRRSGRRRRVLVGTVEMPGEEGKLAFSNAEELWEILEHRTKQSAFVSPGAKDNTGKEV
jgi:hypothetical protein